MRRFAALPGLSAHFRESKQIALLAVPIQSEGELYFTRGRLLRRVLRPTPSAALLTQGRVTFTDGSSRQEIDLAQNPVVRGFVDSFRHLLSGDQEAMQRTYRVRFAARPEAGPEAWSLHLVPRTQALSRFLREMDMEGHGVVVERMRMVEVSGDTTRTVFSEVDANRRFSEAEVRRIFRL
jgi:hypothetical protein